VFEIYYVTALTVFENSAWEEHSDARHKKQPEAEESF
jgi:hypothetical protein